MMYCPVCFNQSLSISTQGVIQVAINGKQRDSGRFLFSTLPKDQKQTLHDFKTKVEEFFQWYSQFMNKEPIYVVELLTPDMKCEKGCRFPPQTRFSAVDIVIPQNLIYEVIGDLGKRYSMKIKLKV